MASRYWVGGTDSWDATAGTKWSLTSGGAGGEAVPTSSDDVFFDANSGAVTITQSGTINFLSLTCTGFTGTFAGSGTLNAYGNVTLAAAATYTNTGTLTFLGSSNLTSNGAAWEGHVVINGSGITVALQDAASFGPGSALGQVTLTQGTFTTNGYSLALKQFSCTGSATAVLNLGASVITAFGTFNNFSNSSGLTINAGTSEFICTSPTTASFTLSGSHAIHKLTFNGPKSITLTGGSGLTNTIDTLKFMSPLRDANFAAGWTLAISTAIDTTDFTALGDMITIGAQSGGASGVTTITKASGTVDIAWACLFALTFSGGATFTGTNCIDVGENTGITITPPNSGGGGVPYTSGHASWAS